MEYAKQKRSTSLRPLTNRVFHTASHPRCKKRTTILSIRGSRNHLRRSKPAETKTKQDHLLEMLALDQIDPLFAGSNAASSSQSCSLSTALLEAAALRLLGGPT